MTNKNSIGKRVLSLILAVAVVIPGFCFFDFTGVFSIAADTETGISVTSVTPAAPIISVPETIYLNPSDRKAFQYYLNDEQDGTVKKGDPAGTSGMIYFNCPGVSDTNKVTVSCDDATVSLGTPTYEDGKYKVSFSGFLNSAQTEATTTTIEWKFTFGGKTYYAYTAVYAPYTSPAFAESAARSYYYNDSDTQANNDAYVRSIAWISGVHSIANGSYKNNANFDPMKGTLPVVTATSCNYNASGWPGAADVKKTTFATETTGTGSFAQKGKDSGMFESGNNVLAQAVAPTATVYFDSSRITNLDQIPNLKFGYYITNVREGSKSGVDKRRIAFYFKDVTTDAATNSSAYTQTTSNDDAWTNYQKTRDLTTAINVATPFTTYDDQGSNIGGTDWISKDGIKNGSTVLASNFPCVYNNSYSKPISASTNVVLKGAVRMQFKVSYLQQSTSSAVLNLTLTAVDKSLLRSTVHTAVYNSAYYSAGWNDYQSKLQAAALVLGQPDATQEQINTAKSNLDAAVASLVRGTGTATATYKSESGILNTTENANYNYGDTVKYSPISINGYTCTESSKTNIDVIGATDSYTFNYTPVPYNIVYNYNDPLPSANPVATDWNSGKTTYNIETDYTLIEPTKVGYTFTGWTYEGQTTPKKSVNLKGMTGDKTFKANWEANKYTISFDNMFDYNEWAKTSASLKGTGYNSATPNAQIEVNKDAVNPEDKTVHITSTISYGTNDIYTSYGNGCYFIPVEPNATYVFSVNAYVSSGKGSVYLFWSENGNDCNTFSANGSNTNLQTGTWITAVTTPADAKYMAVRFGVLAENSDVLYSNINLVKINNTETYNATTYNQAYKLSSNMSTVNKPKEVSYNGAYPTITVPVLSGYKFAGYFTEPNGQGTMYYNENGVAVFANSDLTSNITLYAKWTKLYDVLVDNLFDFDDWADALEENQSIVKKVDYGTNSIVLRTDAKNTNNDLFTKPYDTCDAKGTYKMQIVPGHTYRISADVKAASTNSGNKAVQLYAFAYRDENCTAPNAGSDGYRGNSDTVSIAPGETKTVEKLFTVPNDANYMTLRLGMCSTGASEMTFSNIRVQDMSVTVSGQSYTIGKFTDIKDITFAKDVLSLSQVKIPDTSPVVPGYEFKGWFGSYDSGLNGTGTQYTGTEALGGNIHLYSKWAVVNYNINYNFVDIHNKSITGTGVTKPKTTTYNINTPDITVTKTDVAVDGYTFRGLYTESNFPAYSSGTGKLNIPSNYNEYNSVTVKQGSTGTKTFYAVWSKIYTVSYEGLEGSSLEGKEPDVYFEDDTSDFVLPTPTKNGYYFTGWTENEGDKPDKNVTIPKGSTGNKKYIANWKPLTYFAVLLNDNDNIGNYRADTFTVEPGQTVTPFENMTLTPGKEYYIFFQMQGNIPESEDCEIRPVLTLDDGTVCDEKGGGIDEYYYYQSDGAEGAKPLNRLYGFNADTSVMEISDANPDGGTCYMRFTVPEKLTNDPEKLMKLTVTVKNTGSTNTAVFKNFTVIESEKAVRYNYGTGNVVTSYAPEKESDKEYHYTFANVWTNVPDSSATGYTEYAPEKLPNVKNGAVYYAKFTAEAHHFNTGTVTQAPTCTETGLRHKTCDICTDSFDFDEAAIGHNVEGNHTPYKAPTCSQPGTYEYYYCVNCKQYYEDEACTKLTTPEERKIPATGNHTYWKGYNDGETPVRPDSQYESVAASCAGDGNIASYYTFCKDCGVSSKGTDKQETFQLEGDVPPGHTWVKITAGDPDFPATCTTAAQYYYVCSVCYVSAKDVDESKLPEDGRTFGNGNPLGHVGMQSFEATAATCISAGNTAYWYCPVCEKYYGDNKFATTNEIAGNSWVLPALGHIWPTEPEYEWTVNPETLLATCKATYICQRDVSEGGGTDKCTVVKTIDNLPFNVTIDAVTGEEVYNYTATFEAENTPDGIKREVSHQETIGYTVTWETDDGIESISGKVAHVKKGEGFTFSVIYDSGHNQVKPDASYEGLIGEFTKSGDSYVVKNVTGNIKIVVPTELNTYNVNVSAGDGVSITSAAQTTVKHGDNYELEFKKLTGYKIENLSACVKVNGNYITVNDLGDDTYKATVSGDSGKGITGDTTITITVIAIQYPLTVNYLFVDGTEAAASVTMNKSYNTTYSIKSPEIPGYVPVTVTTLDGEINNSDATVVEGLMPLVDVTTGLVITVYYKEDKNGNGVPDEDDSKLRVTYDASEHGTVEGKPSYDRLYKPNAAYKPISGLTVIAENGYKFDGWDEAGIPEYITEDITVKAIWSILNYTLTLNSNGGKISGETTTTINYNVESDDDYLPTPERAGYIFSGWTVTSAGEQSSWKNGMANIEILSRGSYGDVTLTAQWVRETYTVKYVLDGGMVSGTNRTSYNIDSDSFTLLNPSKSGYAFAGWSGDGIEGLSMSVTIAKGSFGDRTYTANWTPNSYTIQYVGTGSTSGSTPNSTHYYDTESNLSLNGFKREFTVTLDYAYSGVKDSKVAASHFAGWKYGNTVYNDGARIFNLAYTDGTVLTFTAQWSDVSITLDTPTRNGYTFQGWYDENGSKVTTDTYKPTADVTLTAHWQVVTYNVSFDGNGSTSGSIKTTTFTYDVEEALPANKFKKAPIISLDTRGGRSDVSNLYSTYTFLGWALSPDGEVICGDGDRIKNLGTTDGETVKLYAIWDGGEVTLPDATRSGYTFTGWYDAATGGNLVGDSGTVIYPTVSTKIYAQWEIVTYEVHYNGNGATAGTMENSVHSYNVSQALTKNAFERKIKVSYDFEGLEPSYAEASFLGWAETADGTYRYTDGYKVLNLLKAKGVFELYAKWRDGSVTLKMPVKDGYIFQGWYDENDKKVGNAGDTYKPTEDITLYPKWNIKQYTVVLKNADGKVISEQKLDYNSTFVLETATMDYDDTYHYNFTAWQVGSTENTVNAGTTVTVEGDIVYTATYTKEAHAITSSVKVEATCASKGTTTYKCDACGYSYDKQDIDVNPDNHTGETYTVHENVVNANCITKGSYDEVTYCKGCNKKLNSVAHSDEYDMTNHIGKYSTREENKVVATCVAAGSYELVTFCSSCNTVISRKSKVLAVDKTNHVGSTYEKLGTVVEATCAVEGSKQILTYCSSCNTLISSKVEKFEKLEHSYGRWTVAEEATHLSTGKEVRICVNCKDAQYRTIPRLVKETDTYELVGNHILESGTEADIRVKVMPDDAVINDEIRWYSSDEKIAIIDENGKIQLIGVGEVTITARMPDDKYCFGTFIVELGNNIRRIKFLTNSNMTYLIEDTYSVSSTSTLIWTKTAPVTFSVLWLGGMAMNSYYVSIDGERVEPNADGTYTIPPGNYTPIVTVTAAVVENDDVEGKGRVSFWQLIVNFFKKLFSIFKKG